MIENIKHYLINSLENLDGYDDAYRNGTRDALKSVMALINDLEVIERDNRIFKDNLTSWIDKYTGKEKKDATPNLQK